MIEQNNNFNKIFIIGLPRTATTCVCKTLLDLGFKTAHTAYTQQTLAQAQVIADTPIFVDYQQLDQQFTGSKFIYLERELSLWLPSIKQLLQRMATNLLRSDGGFNPHLKRCYQQIFSPFTLENIQSDKFLRQCYLNHQQAVFSYFSDRPDDILTLDVTQDNSIEKLLNFVNIAASVAENVKFEPINIAGKVTAWNEIKHSLKIASTRNGKIDSQLFSL